MTVVEGRFVLVKSPEGWISGGYLYAMLKLLVAEEGAVASQAINVVKCPLQASRRRQRWEVRDQYHISWKKTKEVYSRLPAHIVLHLPNA